MTWRIEYDNDTGPCDEGFWEWLEVTDGRRGFRCDDQADAEFLLSILSADRGGPVAWVEREPVEWVQERPAMRSIGTTIYGQKATDTQIPIYAAAPSTPQPAQVTTRAELEAKFDKWWFSVGQDLDEKWPASVYGDAKMGFVEVTLATPQPDTVQVPREPTKREHDVLMRALRKSGTPKESKE